MPVCCAAYMWHITGPSGAPGLPAWQTPPDTLRAVLNESINLFYINIGLAAVHLNPLPAVASHPVSEASHSREHNPLHRKLCSMFNASPAAHLAFILPACALPLQALFNVVIAWSLMLGPLMFADRKAANVPRKWPLYIGSLVSRLLSQQRPHSRGNEIVIQLMHAMTVLCFWSQFITNIFFVPFIALRESMPAPVSKQLSREEDQRRLPSWSPLAGWIAAAVFAISVGWAAVARPEFGGIAERLQYLTDNASNDRLVMCGCRCCPSSATLYDKHAFASKVAALHHPATIMFTSSPYLPQISYPLRRVTYAFVLDVILYAVWQAVLMPPSAGRLRFIPFGGLVSWLTSKSS